MFRFVFQAVLAVVDPLAHARWAQDFLVILSNSCLERSIKLGNSWATDVCATLDWCCQIVWRNDSHGHDVYAVKPAN